jgi:hypothetical protein
MKEEDKELLLKDLTARIKYGVKVLNTTYKNHDVQTVIGIVGDEVTMAETYTSVRGDDFEFSSTKQYTGYVDFIKPFFRSIPSLTEKEQIELGELIGTASYNMLKGDLSHLDALMVHIYKNHIDAFGLIPKGLALEAPEDMYNNINDKEQ